MAERQLKILFLSDANSAHSRKWILSLANHDYLIGLFSLSKLANRWFSGNKNIQFLSDGLGFETVGGDVEKLKYIRALPKLKKAIKSFQPDILHAHYATSYGLLGALTGFHPFIVSVWGSDIYDFPKKSFLHRFILKRNLKRSDCVLSTSQSMALETTKYTKKKIHTTPFGIEIEKFKPQRIKSLFNEGDIVIGTIKALEPKYGINYLISAFDKLCKRHPSLPLRLIIVGKGSEESSLKAHCQLYGIEDKVKFTGWIEPEDIPIYHNMIDVFVALSVSESESFGVAAIEAEACAKPVVVSDVSGFKEVVEEGVTGIIVPKCDSTAAANAIEKLVLDPLLRRSMGEAGRKRVEKLYNWDLNFRDIMSIYDDVIDRHKGFN